MEQLYREKLGADIPGVIEILNNVSLILSNGHFSLNKPKPYLPDVVDVAGIHSRQAKPLPKVSIYKIRKTLRFSKYFVNSRIWRTLYLKAAKDLSYLVWAQQ